MYNHFIVFEYYVGEPGGICFDDVFVIRSKKECTVALEKLGYQSAGNNEWAGQHSQIPAGCSLKNNVNLHFETSPKGLGNGRNDLTPICRSKKTGTVDSIKICVKLQS